MQNYCTSLFSTPKSEWERVVVFDVAKQKAYTNGELQTNILKTAFFLKEQGIEAGSVLCLHLHNSIEALVVHFAAQFLGATSCLLDPLIRPTQLPYYLKKTESLVLFTHLSANDLTEFPMETSFLFPHQLEEVWEGLSSCTEEEMHDWSSTVTSYIYFTSGTTSLPKGVPLNYSNHENFFKIADQYWQPVDETSTHLCFVPFSHGFGSIFLIPLAFRTKSRLVIMRSFHPGVALEAIEKYSVTHIYGVPPHYQQLLKMPGADRVLPKLKMAFCAAAKLEKEVVDLWNKLSGIRLEEGYGLIETTGGIVWRVGDKARCTGHMGELPHRNLIEVGIINEEGAQLAPEERGEIAVRGKSVMKGYLDMPEENSRAFVNGWFRTGDEGYISQDRHLFMTGRIKDIINIAGIKISPFEVESVLIEHPNVEQAIVVASTDPIYGEIVKAYVKRHDESLTERDLVKFASNHLISYQVPKKIDFVSEYPLNNMNKIDRKKLRLI